MRSGHVIYRALTVPAELVEGSDGVAIIAPRFEFFDELWLATQIGFAGLLIGFTIAMGQVP